MSTILIKNGYFIDVNNKEKSGIKDIFIQDDIIKKISDNIEEDADKIIDANKNIVMPGLINTHNHSAMTLFRGYADDLELMDWLKNKIWPIEDTLTGEDIYYGSLLACIEMIKSGTTTFNDMYAFIEETIKTIDETGIRATLGRAILDIKDEKDIRIKEAINLIEKYTR